MTGYYYLHENGDLIWKVYRPEQEPGGFVRRVWPVDTSDRSDAWKIILESLALGANIERVEELAEKWGCDARDFVEYMRRNVTPTQEQSTGGALFLTEIVGVDVDEWCDWLDATPKGEEPNFSLMPTGK